jgi:hypothetical protein
MLPCLFELLLAVCALAAKVGGSYHLVGLQWEGNVPFNWLLDLFETSSRIKEQHI